MEVLFHGIFTLIKLAILGSIYASLTLLVFRLVAILQPTSWANQVSKKKLKFWFLSGAIISISLLIFATSHWGSHGFGDTARIPLSYGKSINEINGTQAYIQDIKYKYGDLWIEKFAITSDFVIGRTKISPVDDPKNFFAWNLKTNHIDYFDTRNDLENFVQSKNLPINTEMRSFGEHYSEFWHAWRFLALL